MLLSVAAFSQRPNKTFSDSLFYVGDIIDPPKIMFALCKGCPDGMMLEARDSIQKITNFLNKHRDLIVCIESHTDQRGSASANFKLSQDRAGVIRLYIIKFGLVDTLRIHAKGFGESCPIIPQKEIEQQTTREEKEKLYMVNRRTVLRVIGKKLFFSL